MNHNIKWKSSYSIYIVKTAMIIYHGFLLKIERIKINVFSILQNDQIKLSTVE